MADGPMLLLAGGGLPCLVATSVILSRTRPSQVIQLHLGDHRTNAAARLASARKQAKHFDIAALIERDLPHLPRKRQVAEPREQTRVAMHTAQLLTVGLALAIEQGVSSLVWPAHTGANVPQCATMTEQAVLLRALAQIESPEVPPIETPLLELNDKQLIELGGQLNVPWALAWSCLLNGELPCRVCKACRRRHEAFDAAGMVDPIDRMTGASVHPIEN